MSFEKNKPRKFGFEMRDSNGVLQAGKTVTAMRSIDHGAFVAATGVVIPVGGGTYGMNSTAADNNGESIIYKFSAPSCEDTPVFVNTEADYTSARATEIDTVVSQTDTLEATNAALQTTVNALTAYVDTVETTQGALLSAVAAIQAAPTTTTILNAIKADVELRRRMIGAVPLDHDKATGIVVFKTPTGQPMDTVQLARDSEGVITTKIVVS